MLFTSFLFFSFHFFSFLFFSSSFIFLFISYICVMYTIFCYVSYCIWYYCYKSILCKYEYVLLWRPRFKPRAYRDSRLLPSWFFDKCLCILFWLWEGNKSLFEMNWIELNICIEDKELSKITNHNHYNYDCDDAIQFTMSSFKYLPLT